MTPETPAKVTATTLPDEPAEVRGIRTIQMNNMEASILKYIDALLQSFNAERLRAEAAVAEVARLQTIEFVDELGVKQTLTREAAANELREWENEWPGGLAEVESSINLFKRCAEQAETRAEAMAKDAGRLQTLADASGQFYEQGYEHHMIGRLREYIDSEKEAIDTAIEQGAQHG